MDLEILKKIAIQKGYPIIKDSMVDYLSCFVKEKNIQNILEIGLCNGYSASVFLSISNTKITSIELNEERFFEARENLKKMGFDSSRYNLILGDACEIIPIFSGEFDLIFLDGPKGQYINFLPYLKNLLSVGGYLIADNIAFRGETFSSDIDKKNKTIVKNLRLYIQAITTDPQFETQILEIADGVSVSKLKK